jgi:hypothetical protein
LIELLQESGDGPLRVRTRVEGVDPIGAAVAYGRQSAQIDQMEGRGSWLMVRKISWMCRRGTRTLDCREREGIQPVAQIRQQPWARH